MAVKATFFPRFKKVVSLIDSNVEGERHAAADQAYRMCEEQDLSLQEALEGSFGGNGNNEVMQRRIDELEDDNRKLAEAVQELNAKRKEKGATKELFEELATYPQFRFSCNWIYMVALIRVGQTIFNWFSDEFGRGGEVAWGAIVTAAMSFSVYQWTSLEHEKNGLATTLWKAAALGTGMMTAWLAVKPMSGGFFAIIGITFALGVTNACSKLHEKFEKSDEKVFATVRAWFA